MTKEVNIDIGGGKRAEYFSSLAATNREGLFIVLDPKRFKCPYVNLYPNLQLVRWAALTSWELPFEDQTIDNAHLNFVYDFIVDLHGSYAAYRQVVTSLRRALRPTGHVFVREPQAYIETLADLFSAQGFLVSEARKITDHPTPNSVMFNGWAKNTERPEESLYLPMEFTALIGQLSFSLHIGGKPV